MMDNGVVNAGGTIRSQYTVEMASELMSVLKVQIQLGASRESTEA